MKRVFGIETEYGFSGKNPYEVVRNVHVKSVRHVNGSSTNDSFVNGMTDDGHLQGYGISGRSEDGDELAIRLKKAMSDKPEEFVFGESPNGKHGSSDVMLENGARFYVDMGHPEYSTPECASLRDLVIVDKAGERVVLSASGFGSKGKTFKDNTDRKGEAYGTHENYLIDRVSEARFKGLAGFMTAFLVTRPIFAGSGKVSLRGGNERVRQINLAGAILSAYAYLGNSVSSQMKELYQEVQKGLERVMKGFDESDYEFQISQRAEFFTDEIALRTTYDRPIINTRDEPLAKRSKYGRFHVICGDANLSEIACFLKVGTTGLVLDLFEAGIVKPVLLRNPVGTFWQVSRDLDFLKRYKTFDHGELGAIQIQRHYQKLAEGAFRGRDNETDEVLDRWDHVLTGLEGDVSKQVDLDRWLDWRIKRCLMRRYEERGLLLRDPKMRDIDIQYHELGEKGLFGILQEEGFVDRMVSDSEIDRAQTKPPSNTRAWLRGKLISSGLLEIADWDKMILKGGDDLVVLREPFRGTKDELYMQLKQVSTRDELVRSLTERGYIITDHKEVVK